MALQCDSCGTEIRGGKPIQRRLNGRNHYCCCIGCEVKWEKENLVGAGWLRGRLLLLRFLKDARRIFRAVAARW